LWTHCPERLEISWYFWKYRRTSSDGRKPFLDFFQKYQEMFLVSIYSTVNNFLCLGNISNSFPSRIVNYFTLISRYYVKIEF
jgi:hypothetical protein